VLLAAGERGFCAVLPDPYGGVRLAPGLGRLGVVRFEPVVIGRPGIVEGLIVVGVLLDGGQGHQIGKEQSGRAASVEFQGLSPGIEVAVTEVVHPIGDGQQQLKHFVVVARAGRRVLEQAVVF